MWADAASGFLFQIRTYFVLVLVLVARPQRINPFTCRYSTVKARQSSVGVLFWYAGAFVCDIHSTIVEAAYPIISRYAKMRVKSREARRSGRENVPIVEGA